MGSFTFLDQCGTEVPTWPIRLDCACERVKPSSSGERVEDPGIFYHPGGPTLIEENENVDGRKVFMVNFSTNKKKKRYLKELNFKIYPLFHPIIKFLQQIFCILFEIKSIANAYLLTVTF